MNSLSISPIYYAFTIYFENLVRIYLMFPEFTIDSVDFSRIYFEFTIECANSLWNSLVFRLYTLNSLLNHLILHEFAMNLLVVWRFTMNLPSFSRINYEYTLFFAKSLSFSRIYHVLTLFIADSVRIHFAVIFGFANSLYMSSKYHEFTVCFANPLWISYLFREFTLNFLFFCVFTMNQLSISRIY